MTDQELERIATLEDLMKLLTAAEYLLDVANQQRERQDKPVSSAWGYLRRGKGLLYDWIGFYQPTLPVFTDYLSRNKRNISWTRRSQKVFDICQRNKTGAIPAQPAEIKKVKVGKPYKQTVLL